MPGKKHGSGIGDRWHGGKGSRYDVPLTPLGRFSKPFVTGPNRIQKVLEDANIKLGSVASDVLGVSGRHMLKALLAGEQDPQKLANLAQGHLRKNSNRSSSP